MARKGVVERFNGKMELDVEPSGVCESLFDNSLIRSIAFAGVF